MLVAVQLSVAGIISATGVVVVETISSAPDDHFTAGPHCRVIESGSRCVGGTGGCPTVRTRIISPARVRRAAHGAAGSAPDHHFTASPDSRVKISCRRCVRRACVRPTIACRIVSSTGVPRVIGIQAAPNDHLTTGPNRGVEVSDSRRIGSAGGCPRIINASVRSVRYCGKRYTYFSPLPLAFGIWLWAMTLPASNGSLRH